MNTFFLVFLIFFCLLVCFAFLQQQHHLIVADMAGLAACIQILLFLASTGSYPF